MGKIDEQNTFSWDSMHFDDSRPCVINRSTRTKIVYATWKRNQLNEQVALKMILDARITASDEEIPYLGPKSIESEVEVLKKISNLNLENIVEFLGVVEGNLPELFNAGNTSQVKTNAIVLKAYPLTLKRYIEIINLQCSEIIVSELYSLKARVFILMEIMKALTSIHSFGIIHGNIKPENILLSDKCPPTVRVCDFGLSHITDVEDSIRGRSVCSASTNVFQGTKAYSVLGT